MHVSIYDSNAEEWHNKEFVTTSPIGPQAALEWLCQANIGTEHPLGLFSFYGEWNRFVLHCGYTYGSGTISALVVLSPAKISEDVLEILKTSHEKVMKTFVG